MSPGAGYQVVDTTCKTNELIDKQSVSNFDFDVHKQNYLRFWITFVEFEISNYRNTA